MGAYVYEFGSDSNHTGFVQDVESAGGRWTPDGPVRHRRVKVYDLEREQVLDIALDWNANAVEIS